MSKHLHSPTAIRLWNSLRPEEPCADTSAAFNAAMEGWVRPNQYQPNVNKTNQIHVFFKIFLIIKCFYCMYTWNVPLLQRSPQHWTRGTEKFEVYCRGPDTAVKNKEVGSLKSQSKGAMTDSRSSREAENKIVAVNTKSQIFLFVKGIYSIYDNNMILFVDCIVCSKSW